MLSPAWGEPGDTAATHTGILYLSDELVDAPTPGEAVAVALEGSIEVLFDGNSHIYHYPSDAFRIDDNWNLVTVEFEDLAAMPASCDWDYNDRSWTIAVSSGGPISPPPPIETPPVESPPTVPGVPPPTPPTVPGAPPTTPPTVPPIEPPFPPPTTPPTTPPTVPPTSPISVALSGSNGIEGSQEGCFTITRYGDLNQSLTVTFEIDGTATEGEDYAMVVRSVTFDSGEAAADVIVMNWDDGIADDAETVSLTLDPIAGVSIVGSPEFTITIEDSIPGIPPTIPPPPVSIGNFVWLDSNHDGMQNDGEPGIEGVVVKLYRAPGGYLGEMVQTTITDAQGHYLFSGFEEGVFHKIRFVNPSPATLGFTWWSIGIGPGSGLNSDVLYTNSDPAYASSYGFTDVFSLQGGEINETIDAGLFPISPPTSPPPPNAPVIEFRDRFDVKRDHLEVAKWENAFEVSGNKAQVKDDFVPLDEDRFTIYAKDISANKDASIIDTIYVTIDVLRRKGGQTNTWKAIDAATYKLFETGIDTGIFRSEGPIILTSVQNDDIYRAKGILNGEPERIEDGGTNDPTLFAALGDFLQIDYTSSDGKELAVAKANINIEYIIKLHVTVFKVNNTDAVTVAALDDFVVAANQVFAPFGFKIELKNPVSRIAPPNNVNLNNGLDDRRQNGFWGETMDNLLSNVNLRSPNPNDIEIFIVNSLLSGVNGFALRASSFPESPDTIFINGSQASVKTLAHEIGHILLNGTSPEDEHYDGTVGTNITNVMAFPYIIDGTLTESRRLTMFQWEYMESGRPNLLLSPE